MKPNFALTLSFEGIGLLHRAFPGWHSVDEVSLDTGDLSAALADLRAKGERLDINPIRTKLVIPNDQIRFLQFDSDGLGPEEIADAVHRHLDGATPYAVDDLAYDWSISAGEVHVAAVARETLAEAEAFAAEHGFAPLCFVAIPDARDFVGEPWFGETETAKSLLPDGAHVARDTAAIRIIGAAPLASHPPDVKPDAEATSPPAIPQDEKAGSDALPPQDAPAEAEPEPERETIQEPAPEPQPEPEPLAEPQAAVETEPDPAPEPEPEPEPDPALALDPAPEPDTPAEPATPPVAFSSIRARRDDLPPAAPRLAGARRDPVPDAPATPDNTPDDLPPEPPLTSAPPQPAPVAEQITGTSPNTLPEDATARIGASLRPTEADRLAASLDAEGQDPTGDIPPPPAFIAEGLYPDGDDTPPLDDTAPADPPAPAAAQDGPPSFFTRRQSGARRMILRSSARDTAAQETQGKTIFDVREPARVRGKPRFLGLVLTAVLLIFLVGVAAWASIFLEDGIARMLRDGPDQKAQTTALAPSTDTGAPSVPAADAGDLGALPGLSTPAEDTGGEDPERLAALSDATSDLDIEPRPIRPDPSPAELTEDEARTRYAVSGIWQRAPDAPGTPPMSSLDEFYLTSIDPKVLEQDAIALPDQNSFLGDARPDTPAAPPAASTIFRLDPRGFVRASPEGALTPEGVRVFAGKPGRVAPPRPEETLAPPEDDTVVPAPTLSVEALERMSRLRPRARPDDLSETNERETLGGRTRTELAGLRPKPRPPSVQELAEAAAADAAETAAAAAEVTPDPAAVDQAVQEAAALPTPDPLAGATAQAVAVSVKPKPRPNNFARIVQRSQQQAETETVQTAAVAVPRSQRVRPSGPTPTSVARAATEKNALRLKRVNLIGVYGTSSNRRALVRLANGRYKKVQVGDRLDGGRVSAIGTSDLRYVKSGRSVTLTMPRG